MTQENLNPLISVIVPIYKVEQYLGQCVDSVLAQSYGNFELILVDDGSPDNCGKICDEYALQDNRIFVIHKENGGLSDARNSGIKKAIGEYIALIDSDDYVSPFFLEILITNALKYGADVVTTGQSTKFIDGDATPILLAVSTQDFKSRVISTKEAIADLLYQRRPNGAQFNLYKKYIFDNIEYPKGYLYEDMATTYKTYIKAKKICCLDSKLYAYRVRKDSIVRQSFSEKKMISIEITRTLYKDICVYDDSLRKAAASRCFAANFHVFLQVPADNKEHQRKLWEEIKKYRADVLTDIDRRVRSKNRMGAMLAYLGMGLTYKIGRKAIG